MVLDRHESRARPVDPEVCERRVNPAPLAAKPALQRVRLSGPFSNKALLGVGWADAQIESNAKSCPTQHDVWAQFGCGTICGLCRPYIAKMLLTGDTEFSVIIPSANVSPEQDEP